MPNFKKASQSARFLHFLTRSSTASEKTVLRLLTDSVFDEVIEKFAVWKLRWSPGDRQMIRTTLRNRQRRHTARNCPQKITHDFCRAMRVYSGRTPNSTCSISCGFAVQQAVQQNPPTNPHLIQQVEFGLDAIASVVRYNNRRTARRSVTRSTCCKRRRTLSVINV